VLEIDKNSKQKPMTTLLKNTYDTAMSYEAYHELMRDLVQHKKATGADTSEQKVALTKLNASRLKRLDKTISIPETAAEHFRNLPSQQTWLLIVESWCADAVQTIPVLHKITETTPKLTLKIVLRDENEALMNHFLTNGTKSIPKLLIMDDDYKVIDTWGPRSQNATQLVVHYKKEHGVIDDTFKRNLQMWYNQDFGKSIVEEMTALTAKAKETLKMKMA
jgi:hypothetical protein